MSEAPVLWRGIGLSGLVVLLGLCACRPEGPSSRARKPFNLVLISVDTLRADHLSSYGYFRQTSPVIDRLARHGRLFMKAFATSCNTVPSHMSVSTAQYPFEHGVRHTGGVLPDSTPTLAEVLRRHGYETAAFMGLGGLGFRFGPQRGFERGFLVWEYPNYFRALNPHIRPWLEAHQDHPFFVFVHGYDVHDPHLLPPGFDAGRFDPEYAGPVAGTWDEFIRRSGFPLDWPTVFQMYASGTVDEYNALREQVVQHNHPPAEADEAAIEHIQAVYDAQIYYADQGIGRLLRWLEELKLDDRTLIVFMGDHGQEFGEHGKLAVHEQLYDEVLHMPFIIQGPGVEAGKPLPQLVSNIDIMPTVLDLLGVPIPDTARGVSLAGLLQGREAGEVHEAVYAEYEGMRAIRTQDWKLIVQPDGRQELYDLARDPGEQDNVLAGNPAVALALARQFEQTIRTSRPDGGTDPGALRERLRSQEGYW